MFRSRIISSLALVSCATLGTALYASQAAPKPEMPSHKDQYSLFIYETAKDYALRTDAGPAGQQYWAGWAAYHQQLVEAGVARGGMPLQLAESVRQVRVKDGKTSTTVGPVLSSGTELQLSGYMIIEAKSLEDAIAWAAKAPNAGTSVVEVRPAYVMPER